MTFVDPGEPGDAAAGGLRAKDLVNRPLLIRPYAKGTDVGKEDGREYAFVLADVAVLGAAGVEEHSTGVRFSWKRAIPQLEARMGEWVGATPKAQEDKSVILVAFGDRGREAAARALPVVTRLFSNTTGPETGPGPNAYDEAF